jgi:hypothetical protein
LIRLSTSDYQALKEELNRSKSLAVDTTQYPFLGNTFNFLGDSSQRAKKNFVIVYRINKAVIGFYKDGNTILFEKGIK